MRLFPLFLVLAVLTLTASPALAQNGTITVYFDEDYTVRVMDCPGPGLQTLYVVAEGFNTFLSGAQYKVNLPAQMTFLADINLPPVSLGSSVTGISMGFALPQNAFFPVELHQILVLWNCSDCSDKNGSIGVVDHPVFDSIAITDWPNFDLIPGDGRGSAVCQFVELDIKPGSCPNPFNNKLFDWVDEGANPRKGGVLPVAILGSATFDVNDIDLSTLLLKGVAPIAQGGGPKVHDVAGPPAMDGCDCTEDGPDGFDDLTMKFRSLDIAAGIGVSPGPGGVIELTMSGLLNDGTPFEADDCIRIVGNGGKEPPVPQSHPVSLGFANPNPFNPSTRISYTLPEAALVRISVYDVSGRLVDRLVDGHKGPGEHSVEWNAARLSSGVYFYRMTVGEHSIVRRATLVK